MKKRLFLILACLWFIVSFLIIKSTYAKYQSTIDTIAGVKIATWNVVINNQDVVKNSDFSDNLSLTFPGDQYSISGSIVPGSTRIL